MENLTLNTIFFGVPGTGKTYLMTNFYQKKFEFFKTITFHQSFAYEDFVEGIKPNLKEQEKIVYHIEKGVFFQACEEALKLAGYQSFQECQNDTLENQKEKFKEAKPFALFIDEINRANISNVFGELISLLEENKRIGSEQALWVQLPYSKQYFCLPPNLYLLATMNTVDRSVELLDTALRRRFHFIELKPRMDLLTPQKMVLNLWKRYDSLNWTEEPYFSKSKTIYKFLGAVFLNNVELQNKIYSQIPTTWKVDNIEELFKEAEFKGIDLSKMLFTINYRISKLLGEEYAIGHAYLLEVMDYVKPLEGLKMIFETQIIPLLKEYFYNDYGKIGLVLGEDFVIKQEEKIAFAKFSYDELTLQELTERSLYQISHKNTWTQKSFQKIYR